MSKEMELAQQGVKIELHPYLIESDEPHISWHVNVINAQGQKIEGYMPKTFERMIKRLHALMQPDGE